MNRIALVALVVALALVAFGWWGLESDAGRRRFDEMAGMVPAAAYWGGIALGVVALIGAAISAWRGDA